MPLLSLLPSFSLLSLWCYRYTTVGLVVVAFGAVTIGVAVATVPLNAVITVAVSAAPVAQQCCRCVLKKH